MNMMLKSLLTTALLLGSTSAALARPIAGTAGAGVRIDAQWTAGPQVRDHRASSTSHVLAPRGEVRFDHDFRGGQVHDGYGWDRNHYPVDTRDRSTIECRNWDPLVDISNERCAPFNMQPIAMPYERAGWTTLGARDSSVPGSQFITVEQTFRNLQVRAIQGTPDMTKLQVRYMDGSAEIMSINPRMLKRGFMLPLKGKPVDQLIFYTASGSRGVYLVSAY
jgi:hypothetical protein